MARMHLAIPVVGLFGIAASAFAHNAICDCFLNDDGTITCEGGFSDGSTASGIPVHVIDRDGKVLIDGAMSDMSEFTFEPPEVAFKVEFDAGEGHVITIDGRDIEE